MRATRKRNAETTGQIATAAAGQVQQPKPLDPLHGLALPSELVGSLKGKVQNRPVSKGIQMDPNDRENALKSIAWLYLRWWGAATIPEDLRDSLATSLTVALPETIFWRRDHSKSIRITRHYAFKGQKASLTRSKGCCHS